MSIYKKIFHQDPPKQHKTITHNSTFNQAGKRFEDILPELTAGEDSDITELSD